MNIYVKLKNGEIWVQYSDEEFDHVMYLYPLSLLGIFDPTVHSTTMIGYEFVERTDTNLSVFVNDSNDSNKAPAKKENIDWTDVIASAEALLNKVAEDQGCGEDDKEHYIMEAVMKVVYDEGYFKWVNSL